MIRPFASPILAVGLGLLLCINLSRASTEPRVGNKWERILHVLTEDESSNNTESGSPTNSPTRTQVPTVSPNSTNHSVAPSISSAPSASFAPSLAPTTTGSGNSSNVSSYAPSETPSASPVAVKSNAPTTKPNPPTTSPTASPTVSPTISPTKASDAAGNSPHRMSILRLIEKTIALFILLVLSLLAFGFIMTNRYRIYFFLRGVWYTILSMDCTGWILRKLRLSDYQAVDPGMNTIIFEHEMDEGLLMRETDME